MSHYMTASLHVQEVTLGAKLSRRSCLGGCRSPKTQGAYNIASIVLKVVQTSFQTIARRMACSQLGFGAGVPPTKQKVSPGA